MAARTRRRCRRTPACTPRPRGVRIFAIARYGTEPDARGAAAAAVEHAHAKSPRLGSCRSDAQLGGGVAREPAVGVLGAAGDGVARRRCWRGCGEGWRRPVKMSTSRLLAVARRQGSGEAPPVGAQPSAGCRRRLGRMSTRAPRLRRFTSTAGRPPASRRPRALLGCDASRGGTGAHRCRSRERGLACTPAAPTSGAAAAVRLKPSRLLLKPAPTFSISTSPGGGGEVVEVLDVAPTVNGAALSAISHALDAGTPAETTAGASASTPHTLVRQVDGSAHSALLSPTLPLTAPSATRGCTTRPRAAPIPRSGVGRPGG